MKQTTRQTNQPVTTAAIAAQRANIEAQLKQLTQQESAAREQERVRLTTELTSFPDRIGAILGRKVGLPDALKMLSDHIKGKLSFGAAPSVRTYRQPLSEVEKARLKAVLMARQAIVDAGQTPSQSISQISREFKTTDATVNKYKAAWGLTRAA